MERPTSRALDRADWLLVLRRAVRGFVRQRGFDSAAALTFFSTLPIFPGALTVASSFALATDRRFAVDELLTIADEFVRADTVDTLRDPLESLLTLANPGIGLAIGLVLSVWTFSAYATAFGRAVNTAYAVEEGRRLWKFRGLMLVVSLAVLTAVAVIVGALLLTPKVSAAVARGAGLGEGWATAWSVGKWPLIAVLAVAIVAVLYYFTPNVRHERFRWVSYGAIVSILAWASATAGFALYVTTVSRYDRVYGWLGGAFVLLLWLYLTNLVLVFGAHLDAEIVRGRQLRAGIPAEEVIRLPARDTARTLVLARHLAEDQAASRRMREDAEREAAERGHRTPSGVERPG
jgi:membrane protein